MALYLPSVLQNFLGSIDKKPKKSLSQNFLIDGNIVKKIIQEASIEEGETILEIGPGPGVLTQALLEKKADVLAIEKDTIFAQKLSRLDENSKRLKVFGEDFLTADLQKICPKNKKIKVIGSLPYSITSPILGKLMDNFSLFSSMVFVIQEEVAKRAVAKVGTRDYSAFTLFLHFFAEVKYLFKIKSSCFTPKPKVDSAVISLKIKESIDTEGQKSFFSVVKRAFSERRKMLTSTLGKDFGKEFVLKALDDRKLPQKARAETLSLDDFLYLSQVLSRTTDHL